MTGPRYATTASGAPLRGHLLADTPTRPGQYRAALCGERRRKWQRVDDFAVPSAFSNCAECTRLAGPQPVQPPRRIAPLGLTGPQDQAAARTVAEHTTAASRLQRRIAFREGLATSTTARNYQPRPYVQRLATGDDT